MLGLYENGWNLREIGYKLCTDPQNRRGGGLPLQRQHDNNNKKNKQTNKHENRLHGRRNDPISSRRWWRNGGFDYERTRYGAPQWRIAKRSRLADFGEIRDGQDLVASAENQVRRRRSIWRRETPSTPRPLKPVTLSLTRCWLRPTLMDRPLFQDWTTGKKKENGKNAKQTLGGGGKSFKKTWRSS